MDYFEHIPFQLDKILGLKGEKEKGENAEESENRNIKKVYRKKWD